MATINAALTREWSIVAAATIDRVLLTQAVGAAPLIEVAVTDDDSSAPDVVGHLIDIDKGATRDLLGEGVIWARVSPSSNIATAVLVVT